MKCSNCGTQNRKGLRFCENCGTELAGKVARSTVGRKAIYCSNCGQANPAANRFCQNCGQDLAASTQPLPPVRASAAAGSTGSTLGRWAAGVVLLFVSGFLVSYIGLNALGYADLLSPLSGTKTAEAEVMAQEYVEKYYPFLADADRTSYTATIDGIDFYVVDFVNNDPDDPPMGARILVDRMFRFVLAYEVIDGR